MRLVTARLATASDGTKLITLPLAVVVAMAIAIVVLAVLVWSIKRRRRPRLGLAQEATKMDDLVQSIAGLTHGTLVDGNLIAILQNGEFFDELFEELRKARATIDLETFLSKEGEVTRKLTAILLEKRDEGVMVRLMLDANGGRRFGKREMKLLREAGVRIAKYHPIRLSNLGLLNNRDHRKIVVIDGRVGFVGGHCLVDNWMGEGEDKEHFRDISLRIEGPVVAQLQAAFSENWIEETGDIPGGPDFFPEPVKKRGGVRAHVTYTSPQGSPSAVALLHYLAIQGAQKKIRIQNPYFLPDPDARRALVDAVARGVDVRIMMPSASASDFPIVQHAGHHHFGTLLKGGVRIFEYERTLLHQKVMTVDGCWSAVGSTNFDDRSFEVNDEVSIGIVDEDFASQLEKIFESDLKFAREIHLEAWKKRPFWHKLLDGTLFLVNEQL